MHKKVLILAGGAIGALYLLSRKTVTAGGVSKPSALSTLLKPLIPSGAAPGSYLTSGQLATSTTLPKNPAAVTGPAGNAVVTAAAVTAGGSLLSSIIAALTKKAPTSPAASAPQKPGTSMSASSGGGAPSSGGSTSRPTVTQPASYNASVGIPLSSTPAYDDNGNLTGYYDGTTGNYIDLTTPQYDSEGNQIGYLDAQGNAVDFPSTPLPIVPDGSVLDSGGNLQQAVFDDTQPALGVDTGANEDPAVIPLDPSMLPGYVDPSLVDSGSTLDTSVADNSTDGDTSAFDWASVEG